MQKLLSVKTKVLTKTAVLLLIPFALLFSSYTTTPSPIYQDTKKIVFQGSLPFHATLQTRIQILGTPPIQPVRSSGSGVATHLGKTTFEGNATVNFTVQPAQLNGTATFTAANGDQFFTSFTGTTSIIAGSAIGYFEHTITGGTGRFADASGNLTGRSVHTLGALIGSLDFEGTIDY